ncbi:MAG: hypothetical protein ACKVZH_29355 [Blastocatellia bacterium]
MAEKIKTTRARTGRQGRSKATTEGITIERLVVHLSDDPGKNGGNIRLIEQLGEIPVSENYRVDAAREYGSGRWYAFTPRRPDGTFDAKKRWVAECVDLAEADIESDDEEPIEDSDGYEPSAAFVEKIADRMAAKLRQFNPAVSQPSGNLTELVTALKQLDDLRGKGEPQPTSGSADFIGQLRQLEEVRRMFAPKESNPTPIIRESELTTEQALLKLIAEDPLALAAAREKFLGSEGDSLGWLQIAQAFAPVIERGITALASALSPRSSATMPANETPGISPSNQTQNESLPPQTMGGDIQAYQRLVARLLSAMASNADVEPVVTAIDGFCELFPEHQRMVEDLLSAPAESVLQFIGQNVPNAQPVVNAPHALEWMLKLQAAFIPGDEDKTANDESEKESAA